METKIIEEHIKNFMLSYYNSRENIKDIHGRLDELFLLWAKIRKFNFVSAVEDYGINYQDFSDREYDKVCNQIREVIPEIKEREKLL